MNNVKTLGEAIDALSATVAARAGDDPKASYTAALLAAGTAKCAKKLGEEAVEAAIAAAQGDGIALTAEAADVIYHLLVVLQAAGVAPEDVAAELARRASVSGHAEKAARN
jgi:phosphoribosyl-ATP pyrophosphohydrolase